MAAETVDDYVAQAASGVRVLLEKARSLVTGVAPEAQEVMKYGAPTYLAANGKPQVYLYGGRDHINIGFYHGVLLEDPDGLLQGKGKEGRHISFNSLQALDDERVAGLISAAMALLVEQE
jgi:hypothetical protein